jgi:16S rRNA (adenine1518-N6/adenine1519-N6)-dimethyltransferase
MVSTGGGEPGRARTDPHQRGSSLASGSLGGRGRPVALGQHFLADANLLDAIVRDAELADDEVVLEVGGGEGALTRALAPRVRALHVIELDKRLRGALGQVAAEHPNVALHFGDAMRLDLRALVPRPTAVVSNLPYSIATPLILRTIAELPTVERWTVMMQREIADRLRAAPGSRAYGAPSVLVQLACDVTLLRAVDPAVFTPRPRVGSALVRLVRRGPPPTEAVVRLVRAAFAHRRKALARSLEVAGAGPRREEVAAALGRLGLPADARAQALAPEQFAALADLTNPAGADAGAQAKSPTRRGGGVATDPAAPGREAEEGAGGD